ncbi:transposase (fragment) [Agrobacterium tumefaciens str. B6]|uniref:Transposase n=1 Tax=Agrobacterium tumefaciens str. B6 TaxID=1183423 RepID=A0A822VCA2_AGRTU
MSEADANDGRFQRYPFSQSIILHAVFFYVRYPISCRDLQEILAERGIAADHATLNRWAVRYPPLIAAKAQ